MKMEKKVYIKPTVLVVTFPDAIMGDGNLPISSTVEDKPGPLTVAPHQDAEEESNDNPWGDWPQ